jgi:hypothetical protein
MANMNLRAKDRTTGDDRFLSALGEGVDEAGATWEDFYNKTTENNDAWWSKGDINAVQRGVRSTGDIIGLGGGLFGNALGVVGDLLVPDEFGVEAAYQRNIEKPLQEAIMAAADTDMGKKVVKFAKENNEFVTDLGALSNIALVGPLAKVGNSIARNMPTQVEGFYSGNPLKVAAGLSMAILSGTKNAALSALNPKALAFQQKTGLSKGTVEQAKKAEALVTRRKALVSETERGITQDRDKALTKLEKFDAEYKGFGSYTEGSLAYAYLYGKQVGEEPSAFLRENFENLNVLGGEIGPSKQQFNNLVFNNPRTMTTTRVENPPVSLKNQEYLQDRIYNTWGVADNQRNKTAIVIKDPDKQHSMTDQSRMQRNDGTSQFFTNFNKTGIDLRTASPDEVIRASIGRTLTAPQAKIIAEAKEGKKLTPKQLQTRMEGEQRLASEPELVWNPEQELYILQDSFKAGAKELGGVNRITTMDRNGNVNVIVSDRHDMLGFDPIDGKPLITIFPPMQYNVYGGRGKDNYNTKESQLAARTRLAKELKESPETVEPLYNKAGGIKQGKARLAGGEIAGEYSPLNAPLNILEGGGIYDKGRAGTARRINQRIAQEAQNFSPTAGQLAAQAPRVATNAALAANYGAGMLSGQIPQEEQQ